MDTIRKFGLEYCDLPTMIWNVTILWRTFTLNIDKRNVKRIPIIFYIISSVVSASCIYVYMVSMAWFVFVKCRETGDITAAAVVFSLGISSQISTCKLVFMFLNREEIRNLVEAYLHCDSIVDPTSRFARNVENTLKVVKKRAITFWLVIVFNGIVYCIKPIVLPGRHHMEDLLILYGLEPMYESPNYEVAYCITAFGVLFTCYLPANITAFLIVIAGYSEAQLLALSQEITCLLSDAEKLSKKVEQKTIILVNENKYKQIIINEYIRRHLSVIIKKHTMNINLLHQIEIVFRGAIAVEFLLLTVALITELLGGLEKTYIEMPFALMQVGMDCLVGQRVMDASIVFENAVYDSKWEKFDSANMKTVLLMLQNSQKSLTLSAGGMTTLSFTTLMAVMKSIYSTYTALRSAVNKTTN